MCLAKVGALTGEMLQLKLSIRRREPSIPKISANCCFGFEIACWKEIPGGANTT